MSDTAIAADHLKCVRVLSQILADGALPMPDDWHLHTYCDYDDAPAPVLEGHFHQMFDYATTADLRKLIAPYAEKFGLSVEDKPHGSAGRFSVVALGRLDGVELKLWGVAKAHVDVAAEAVVA